MGGMLASVAKPLGKIDPLTGMVNSLLGVEQPATPAVAEPAVKATPTAAITTAPALAAPIAQRAISAGARTSLGTAPRARNRGSRAASVLTTDLGDAKLGG